MKRQNKTFDDILKKALELYVQQENRRLDIEMEKVNSENITFSDNFKQKMNALFRKNGFNHVPHPEVE